MNDVTGLDKVTLQDFVFFVSAVLLSSIILLFLLSSAVSLSYFNLVVYIYDLYIIMTYIIFYRQVLAAPPVASAAGLVSGQRFHRRLRDQCRTGGRALHRPT